MRRRLAALGERERWTGPSPTTMRALEGASPASSGWGRQPPRPWRRVEAWGQALAEEIGRRIAGREGAKGPRGGAAVQRRVVARTHRRQPGDEERLVVRRSRDRDHQQVVHVDDALSNAGPETPLGAWARVAHAEQRSLPPAQQERSRGGGLGGAPGAGVAAASHAVVPGHMVPGQGNPAGKKMDPGNPLPPDSPRYRSHFIRGLSVRNDIA